MKKTERAQRPRDISLRWELFLYLALFIVFVLAVVWLFQVKLLDRFYESIKRRELIRTADTIEEHIGKSSLYTVAYQNAVDYGICVMVLRIEGINAIKLVAVDVTGDSVLSNMTDKYVTELYNKSKEQGGEYIDKRTKGELADAGLYYPRFFFHPQRDYYTDSDAKIVSTILIRLVQGTGDEEYAILLNVEMTPMGAVVSTMSMQYLWIAVALIVGSLFLALIISRTISRPIERMNSAAKRLASGNYDVNFSGEGFREIRELADTLNYAARELSKNDRLQKELIANISHDLRTPLTMITGYGELIRDIPGENTPENIQAIIDEAERLNQLVNDLLDLSRLQAGAGQLKISRFNLTDTVRDTMQRYEKLVQATGYRINFWSDREVYVEADRNMILQVLYNLINNAINYSGEEKLVRVVQSVGEKVVRISVIDTGEGIPPEHLPYIWDRYYKVDKVHRRAAVGTGIGLSIVKNVLELHRARYGVDSTPGKGSTFWFELPTVPPDEVEANTENQN
ncbi:MAG: HAMP domain-containing histidine kinase [Clostridiales bacterium]|nr:HAMP domain-containing histidine kinase [Clostridiales bacterium]